MLSKVDARAAKLIGRRIRELREERGWDQIDLEAHIDGTVKRATISNFETGARLPSLHTLLQLAKAFEVEPAALLLNPSAELKHRIAVAALDAKDDTLVHVGKLLDVR